MRRATPPSLLLAVALSGLVTAGPASAQNDRYIEPALRLTHAGGAPIEDVMEARGRVVWVAGGVVHAQALDGTRAAELRIPGCVSAVMGGGGDSGTRLLHCASRGPDDHRFVVGVDPIALTEAFRVDDGGRELYPVGWRRDALAFVSSAPDTAPRVGLASLPDGRVRWTAPLVLRRGPTRCTGRLIFDGRRLVHHECGGGVVVRDVSDGRVLWTHRAPDPMTRLFLFDDVVVAVDARRALGLDVRSGARRFTHEPGVPVQRPLALDAHHLLVASWSRELVLLDVRDGSIGWRAPVHTPSHLATTRDAVVAVDPQRGLRVLDRATGATRWSVLGVFVALAVSDDTAFALEHRDPTHGGHQLARLVSVELSTGRVSVHPRRVSAASPLLVVRDAVHVCTDGGAVRAVDGATGAARWTARVGGGDGVVPCRLWAMGTAIAVRGPQGELLVLDPASRSHALADVRVEGELRGAGRLGGAHVWINDRPIRAHADGRFEATLRTRGMLTVQLDPEDAQARCIWAEPVRRRLRPGRPATVVLRTRRDYCACHPCD